MIKAIVYTSNSGFTKNYAQMISEKTGLPAYTFKEAGETLKREDKVFYMGWVLGSRIKGYTKAALMYNVVGLCGVGMSFKNKDTEKLLREGCGIYSPKVKLFYAQGGFDPGKVENGVHAYMLRSAYKTLKNSKKPVPNKAELLQMLEKGGDYTKRENILPAVNWIKLYNRHAAAANEEK